ncbi:ribonuclease BN [Intrasporangium oryzae NRRL B-24470]|uniref:Ribonuclease BN n=1 Tax=Intrasporangium oryzae NRRL B-24470 TaxID=1386089 RepID=W9GD68_9MICO|nr:YihY/virulence factor BrkB family protein [Intrasporangium oryzae]EWT02778.1 ribonuclease BN [Intrasporangium oryzae NRRL B-24470]
MASLAGAVAWARETRAWSAWQRYTGANGNLLSAGVAYYSFFSIFPAATLAFTIFGFVLRGRPELLASVVSWFETMFPGMVKTPEHPDGIISVTTPAALTLTLTGVVALLVLLWAGLGWVGALRTGIRGIFGLGAWPGTFVAGKARDLAVLFVLGFAILVSAVLSTLLGAVTGSVASWVGLAGEGPLVAVLGLFVAVLVDTAIMVVLLRILSGVPLPWANVRDGAIVGAVLLTVLKYFGAQLIARSTSNPLLGAVAVSVGLLVWLNLIARVVLLSAAWSADKVALARTEVRPGPDALEPAGESAGESAGERLTRVGDRAASPGGVADVGRVSPAAGTTDGAPLDRVALSSGRRTFAAGAMVGAAAAALLASRRKGRRRAGGQPPEPPAPAR